MRNRIPTYPGRVHLAPVEGKTNVFDLTRADEPTDPGTPINKGTMLDDDVEAAIWGAPADRTVNDAFSKISELYQHWWSATNSAGEIINVRSTDRNAYPDSGTVDGLTYKYLGVPFENAKTAPQMEFVSYTGTGVYGASNPCKLTFANGLPDFILYLGFFSTSTNRFNAPGGDTVGLGDVVIPATLTTTYRDYNGFFYGEDRLGARGRIADDGVSVQWYHEDAATNQRNATNCIYYYVGVYC